LIVGWLGVLLGAWFIVMGVLAIERANGDTGGEIEAAAGPLSYPRGRLVGGIASIVLGLGFIAVAFFVVLAA
jgi:hypothetical protein